MKIEGPFYVESGGDYERAFVVGKHGRIMCSVLGDLQTINEKREHAKRIAFALNASEGINPHPHGLRVGKRAGRPTRVVR